MNKFSVRCWTNGTLEEKFRDADGVGKDCNSLTEVIQFILDNHEDFPQWEVCKVVETVVATSCK